MWNDHVPHPGELVFFGKDSRTDMLCEWIVLEVKDKVSLIASTQSVTECIPYHNDGEEQVSWEDSTLRLYLNQVFINCFTESEQSAIHETDIPVSAGSGKCVRDKVFILSPEEAARLFKTREERVLTCSHSSNRKWDLLSGWIDCCQWPLRAVPEYSGDDDELTVPACGFDGDLGLSVAIVDRSIGVRACMWVDNHALNPQPDHVLDKLHIRLLEKDPDKLITFEGRREKCHRLTALFADDDKHEIYGLISTVCGYRVIRLTADCLTDWDAEEKGRILGNLLERIPYRSLVEKTRQRYDSRRVLSWMMRPEWQPSRERIREYRTGQVPEKTPFVEETGEYVVRLGRYNGQDLHWRILRKNDNKVYALCETVVNRSAFMGEEDDRDFSWKNSFIRFWLKKYFYSEAFSSEEKKRIFSVVTEEKTQFSPEVRDKVFIMSAAECRYLLPAKEERLLSRTPPIEPGLPENAGKWWWLRTGADAEEHFLCIDPHGEIRDAWGHGEVCGIRPVIAVDLYGSEIQVKYRPISDWAE